MIKRLFGDNILTLSIQPIQMFNRPYYFDVNFHDFIEWLSDDGLSVSEIQDTLELVGINTKATLDGEDWDLEIIE